MCDTFAERQEKFFNPVLDTLSETELKTHHENMFLRNLRAKVIRRGTDFGSLEAIEADRIFEESRKELDRTESELRKRGISYGQ